MDKSLTPAREARRASIKGLARISITGNLDKELIEDILAAAPEVQILNIDVLDSTSVDLSHLKELKDLLILKIIEGSKLTKVDLDGIQELKLLTAFEVNINPEERIDEIDLAPLANHPELKVVTVAGPLKNLKNTEALKEIPNLESIGLYSLDVEELDLSPLSGCEKLESIYLGDLGPENPTKPYKLTMPRDIPLKILEISECYSDELEIAMDFSFIQDIKSLDSLKLRNCNLTSFDFRQLTTLERIGSIDLTENRITHLDISPILTTPTFTEKALGEKPFMIDNEVIIQIKKEMRNEVPRLLEHEDRIVVEHEGSYAIKYEFGHGWLGELLDNHRIDWT